MTSPRSTSAPTSSPRSNPTTWRRCSSRWSPRGCWSRTPLCSPRCAGGSTRRSASSMRKLLMLRRIWVRVKCVKPILPNPCIL
uniref:26S proteasome non-ATPase regulatory subunit 6 n=1 Tax=Arundo donax TaxID=35708 RepID=A0A0A9DYU9_ARUDO